MRLPGRGGSGVRGAGGAGYEGHKEPWDAFWGHRYAIVHDPDGNGVDLFATA